MKKLSWFVVRRSNLGGVTAVQTGIATEHEAMERADALTKSDPSPLVAFQVLAGDLRKMPRWTVHWRLSR